MKGYLSRIARQSGLRLPEPGVTALAPRGGDRGADPIAPEIEHHIMVAPEAPEPRDTLAVPVVRSPEHVDPDRTQQRREPAQAEARNFSTEEPAAREIKAIGEAARPRTETAPAFPEATVTRFIGHSDEPRPDPTALREGEPHSDLPRPATPEAKAPAQSAGLVPEPKEFFARTVELLNGEGAATADSQTILLREVQEWVAASPIEPPAAQPVPALRETTRVAGVSRARAPEATVIRESRQADEPARQQPLEQRFELSIGSIDVTIEEAEKPHAPEPRQARAEKIAPADTRRFSRLRRGYL